MFPEGQQVEFTEGPFVNSTGPVISCEEVVHRGGDSLVNTAQADTVFVVLTFWGRDVIVPAAPNQIRAI
jgi:hypothetical protein